MKQRKNLLSLFFYKVVIFVLVQILNIKVNKLLKKQEPITNHFQQNQIKNKLKALIILKKIN